MAFTCVSSAPVNASSGCAGFASWAELANGDSESATANANGTQIVARRIDPFMRRSPCRKLPAQRSAQTPRRNLAQVGRSTKGAVVDLAQGSRGRKRRLQ